ncbi:Uncharacterised protein [Kingella potus]|uniref:Uncharacterized protein n=1 Tax=Kingella potus TaxID=265175 RepID=A0A377R3Q2_9NEIS|nr:Uncharacterised protein [Kingella potus]
MFHFVEAAFSDGLFNLSCKRPCNTAGACVAEPHTLSNGKGRLKTANVFQTAFVFIAEQIKNPFRRIKGVSRNGARGFAVLRLVWRSSLQNQERVRRFGAAYPTFAAEAV